MKNNNKIIIGIIALGLVVVLVVLFYHSKPAQRTESSSSATSTSTTVSITQESTSTTPDLYALSSADRDSFLFMGNQNKDYQFVVNATDYGIKNHKDLIWNDIDFWNHRGFALYSLGNCADAGAAFYHVLLRAPNDDVASGFLANILNDKNCGTTTLPSNIDELTS